LERSLGYRSRVFVVLWLVNFLLMFTVSLVSTPKPYLAKEFAQGSDAAAVEAATTEAWGIILSLGFVASTLGYFIGGFAADAVGKRTVVMGSFAVLAVGCSLFAVAPNMYFLFLASFVEMFAVGLSGPAISALAADCSAQSSRGMAYGVFNLSWVFAQVPAPLLGGLIGQVVNLHTPFLIAIFISIAGMGFSILMQRKNAATKKKSAEDPVAAGITSSKQATSLRKVVLIFSATNLSNGVLNGFVSPLLTGILMFRLSANLTEYGLVLSIASSLVTGLVQIPGGKLTDKFGRKPLVLFGFLCIPLVLLLAYSRTLLDFTLIMSGISAIGNISSPAVSAWMMDLIPEHRRASVSGVTQGINGIGLSVGPAAGSYAWNSTKPDAAVPCGIAAIIFATALPFYLMLKDSKVS
jgi:MFS family permease